MHLQIVNLYVHTCNPAYTLKCLHTNLFVIMLRQIIADKSQLGMRPGNIIKCNINIIMYTFFFNSFIYTEIRSAHGYLTSNSSVMYIVESFHSDIVYDCIKISQECYTWHSFILKK